MNLTKKKFCEVINYLQMANDADNKVDEARRICQSDFMGSDLSYLSEQVIDLLAILMNIDADTIAYFCYELDFGRSEIASVCDSDECDENGKLLEKTYDWSSAEKFYDYLVETTERK